MLIGNQEEVRGILFKCLQLSLWAAWDVAKGTTEGNVAGRAFLDILTTQVTDRLMLDVSVTPSDLPLHGTIKLAEIASQAADLTQELYGKPMLSRKHNNIRVVFKDKLDSAMCMVPRTKKDLYRKYPELDPNFGKKRRKPRGKA